MLLFFNQTGINTPTLTISPVREDEDEYYCVTSNRGVDGIRYSDTFQKARVTVFGKLQNLVLLFSD